MKNTAHPEAILRLAWNTHRLDVIRGIVEETIQALQAAHPEAVEQQAEGDSARQALFTCCNELREACGLPLSRATDSGEAASTAARQHASWRQSYDDALEKYRVVAGAALQAALSELEGSGPSVH